jgi:two-component system phosphate regulon sensor histidine kinase PhoR
MGETGAPPSPLLRALLPLIADGADEATIAATFARLGMDPRPGVIHDLLEDAAALGLVRVAAPGANGPRFVLTSLGQQLTAADDLDGADSDRLRDLETLRTDLSATIAHELRTPLTAIRTCAGLLMSDDAQPSPEQHRTLVQTIERNAERMQRVVGDILDLARFRAGSIALQLRRFDPVAMGGEVIASIAPVAEAEGVRVELASPSRRLTVFGDHRRLEQAVLNLVSNAVRFSPAGGRVVVEVSAAQGWVRVAVRDDGPGIAPDDQRRLFERFFVGRTDRTGPRDGVGLGLPTALAIAQAHGGRIEVQSAPGAGSTFSLVVPQDGPADMDAGD